MDPVSNANRIAMLLRARLEERARAGGSSRAKGADQKGAADVKGGGALAQVEAIEGLDDRKLKRALIESLLTDQLGDALVNDARFQQVVGQVVEAIEADEDGNALFARVVADLRSAPR
jgi:hypothetical protein